MESVYRGVLSTSPRRKMKTTLLERFEAKYTPEPNSGCWLWIATTNNEGYGLISKGNHRHSLAHRVAYEMFIGKIPDGMDLDHKCRVRCCVNPGHLEPVTRSVNLRRGFEARGCVNGHPFSEENFALVRHANGTTDRRCKICHRERLKKWYAAHRDKHNLNRRRVRRAKIDGSMKQIDVSRGDSKGWTTHRLNVPPEVFLMRDKDRADWIAARIPRGFSAFVWVPTPC